MRLDIGHGGFLFPTLIAIIIIIIFLRVGGFLQGGGGMCMRWQQPTGKRGITRSKTEADEGGKGDTAGFQRRLSHDHRARVMTSSISERKSETTETGKYIWMHRQKECIRGTVITIYLTSSSALVSARSAGAEQQQRSSNETVFLQDDLQQACRRLDGLASFERDGGHRRWVEIDSSKT